MLYVIDPQGFRFSLREILSKRYEGELNRTKVIDGHRVLIFLRCMYIFSCVVGNLTFNVYQIYVHEGLVVVRFSWA